MTFFSCRCEIEATLERLKKLERDLSTKEQELQEREQRLKMWERKLIEQSSSPVSPSLAPLHLDPPFSLGADEPPAPPPPSPSPHFYAHVRRRLAWVPTRRTDVF